MTAVLWVELASTSETKSSGFPLNARNHHFKLIATSIPHVQNLSSFLQACISIILAFLKDTYKPYNYESVPHTFQKLITIHVLDIT